VWVIFGVRGDKVVYSKCGGWRFQIILTKLVDVQGNMQHYEISLPMGVMETIQPH